MMAFQWLCNHVGHDFTATSLSGDSLLPDCYECRRCGTRLYPDGGDDT